MSGERDALVAKALLAFSDACTLPQLTPNCPFYRTGPEGPTCNEECRDVLAELGVPRPTRTVSVLDGLVMIGVARPIEVASGQEVFDAGELVLREIREPAANASTTTLLLRLRDLAATPPSLRGVPAGSITELWGVLERRGVPVDAVLRVGIAPMVASAIVQLVKGARGPGIEAWRRLFADCRPVEGAEDGAYEGWFTSRVAGWFARLLDTDSAAFFNWDAPQKALLMSMPESAVEPESVWLWERFTVTSHEEWATSSLILEWDRARGRVVGDCPERVLAARSVDQRLVAEAALDRLAKRVNTRPEERWGLHADHFAAKAAEHLLRGERQEAEDIFTALAYVHPADGDALNNLGFCIIPDGAVRALGPLQRAAGLPMEHKAVNTVNLALVQHLLGNNSEALETLARTDASDDEAFVWVEPECGLLQLDNVPLAQYVAQLAEHIRERASAGRPSDR